MSEATRQIIFEDEATPWFNRFTNCAIKLRNLNLEAEFTIAYDSIYAPGVGYEGPYNIPSQRLPAIAQFLAIETLGHSLKTNANLSNAFNQQRDEFAQWFLFRKTTDQWINNFVQYATIVPNWLSTCEKIVPTKLGHCSKIPEPDSYRFFNPYLNVSLAQIAANFISPYVYKVYSRTDTEEDREKILQAEILLKYEEEKGLSTYRSIIPQMVIHLARRNYKGIKELADTSLERHGENNYNYITAANLLLSHQQEDAGRYCFKKQNKIKLKGRRLLYLSLHACLWNDPSALSLLQRADNEFKKTVLSIFSPGSIALLSILCSNYGKSDEADLLWKIAIKQKPILNGLEQLKILLRGSPPESKGRLLLTWAQEIIAAFK